MLKNALALLTTAILLILGIMFSVVLLAVVAVLGIAAWAYLWWRTRALRSAMREQAGSTVPDSDGRVIEGETVVVEDIAELPEQPATENSTRPPPG